MSPAPDVNYPVCTTSGGFRMVKIVQWQWPANLAESPKHLQASISVEGPLQHTEPFSQNHACTPPCTFARHASAWRQSAGKPSLLLLKINANSRTHQASRFKKQSDPFLTKQDLTASSSLRNNTCLEVMDTSATARKRKEFGC